MTLPKYLPDGVTRFHHGSHPAYNQWVKNALNKINNTVPDDQLLSKMEELKNVLKNRIEEAYRQRVDFNTYFELGNVPPF